MVPLIDTIKEVKGGYVVHTPERSNYMSAQTPQAFRTELIKKCHEEAKKHPEIVASEMCIRDSSHSRSLFFSFTGEQASRILINTSLDSSSRI